MAYLTNIYRDNHQKELKKCLKKVRSSLLIQSADCPEIELKVPCDVIESVEFGKIYEFCDVTTSKSIS